MAQLEFTELTRKALFPGLAQASDGPQLAPTTLVPELVVDCQIFRVFFLGNEFYFDHL